MSPLLFFWLNGFFPSNPGAGLYNTRVPRQLVLGTVVYYKKVFHLQTGKYVQVHQKDEPWNTIDIDRTAGAIILVPQYNLQGGFLFGILTTGKHLRRSHWTPFNITEDVIECYDNFNTKRNPDEPLVGKFHY